MLKVVISLWNELFECVHVGCVGVAMHMGVVRIERKLIFVMMEGSF